MSAKAIRVASAILVTLAAAAFVWLAVMALAPARGAGPVFVVAEGDELQEDLTVMDRPVIIAGRVRGGVLSLGGDVTVSGEVDGDVAAIGGSVVQSSGSHVSGDVLIVGGRYVRASGECRGSGTETVVFAGTGESLREFFANPARQLLVPKLDRSYVGWRVAAALASFLLAIALVAIAPIQISRASERLAADPLKIAAIGLVGTLAVVLFVGITLVVMPAPLSAAVSGLMLLLVVVVQLFGRVVAYFLVGRWLQRRAFGETSRSQTIALLLGVLAFALVGSLPIVGALLVFATFVLSVGILLATPAAAR
jgi:hypothetical protein